MQFQTSPISGTVVKGIVNYLQIKNHTTCQEGINIPKTNTFVIQTKDNDWACFLWVWIIKLWILIKKSEFGQKKKNPTTFSSFSPSKMDILYILLNQLWSWSWFQLFLLTEFNFKLQTPCSEHCTGNKQTRLLIIRLCAKYSKML